MRLRKPRFLLQCSTLLEEAFSTPISEGLSSTFTGSSDPDTNNSGTTTNDPSH